MQRRFVPFRLKQYRTYLSNFVENLALKKFSTMLEGELPQKRGGSAVFSGTFQFYKSDDIFRKIASPALKAIINKFLNYLILCANSEVHKIGAARSFTYRKTFRKG